MIIRNKIKLATVAAVIGTAAVGTSLPVYADNAGAFIGGVFATKVMTNMHDRTEAEQQQAAAAQQQAARPVQSAPAQKSPQARIAELDKLAAGGYITPEEYKTKKQAIIDSM
jgi:membrane protease subunit (stomatin/prohibitin family)